MGVVAVRDVEVVDPLNHEIGATVLVMPRLPAMPAVWGAIAVPVSLLVLSLAAPAALYERHSVAIGVVNAMDADRPLVFGEHPRRVDHRFRVIVSALHHVVCEVVFKLAVARLACPPKQHAR